MSLALAIRFLPISQQLESLPSTYRNAISDGPGLMVASPLEQWSSSCDHKRIRLRAALKRSKGPEIRAWPDVRAQQLREQKKVPPHIPMPTNQDYWQAFSNSVLNFDVRQPQIVSNLCVT